MSANAGTFVLAAGMLTALGYSVVAACQPLEDERRREEEERPPPTE